MFQQCINWRNAVTGREWYVTALVEGIHIKALHPVPDLGYFEAELTIMDVNEKDLEETPHRRQERQKDTLATWFSDLNKEIATEPWTLDPQTKQVRDHVAMVRGATIRDMWETHASLCLPANINSAEVYEAKKAFYAGAYGFHAAMAAVMNTAADVEAVAWMEARFQEAEEFTLSLLQGKS